jgi:hypothetical protein
MHWNKKYQNRERENTQHGRQRDSYSFSNCNAIGISWELGCGRRVVKMLHFMYSYNSVFRKIPNFDVYVYSLPYLPHISPLLIFLRYKIAQYRLCGLVVRVPGYGTEMYCVSSELRTEFISVM